MRIKLTKREYRLYQLMDEVDTMEGVAKEFGLSVRSTRRFLCRLVEMGAVIRSNRRPDFHCIESKVRTVPVYCYQAPNVDVAIEDARSSECVAEREPPLKPAPRDLVAKALASRSALEQIW